MSKITQADLNKVKVGSKVKVYNMFTKRMRTLEVCERLEDGRLELLNGRRIYQHEIEQIVSF